MSIPRDRNSASRHAGTSVAFKSGRIDNSEIKQQRQQRSRQSLTPNWQPVTRPVSTSIGVRANRKEQHPCRGATPHSLKSFPAHEKYAQQGGYFYILIENALTLSSKVEEPRHLPAARHARGLHTQFVEKRVAHRLDRTQAGGRCVLQQARNQVERVSRCPRSEYLYEQDQVEKIHSVTPQHRSNKPWRRGGV